MVSSSPEPAAGADSAALTQRLGEHAFERPLAELCTRAPVSCLPQTPLREALQTLRAERIGCIVVVDEEHAPLGILTLGDVLVRVTLPQLALETPVAQAMSRPVHCLPAQAPVFAAALLMARENIRHVPLLEQGRLAGVVSESRLFALWRRSLVALRARILNAPDIDALVRAAAGLRALPGEMLQAGLTAEAITGLLTHLNDEIVSRLLVLTGTAQALERLGGCWLALGSQGREEQTLATDQDNAILFDDAGDPEERRRELLPLARRVNEALDHCGFPLCRGNIMASNPQWCLSAAEWRACFAAWINEPQPQALLNAAIFFDFRAIGGHPAAVALRKWLSDYARASDRFLLMMVFNALGNQPPLGLLRDFVLARGGEHPHTLDLKVNGVQPFVESARVLGLCSGATQARTLERLRSAGLALSLPEHEMAAYGDAFRTLQRLRLQLNAQQMASGTAAHNFLDPDGLNDLDRTVLREALRQARNLQARLAQTFSLSGTAARA